LTGKESIQSCFSRSPKELAIFVALAFQSSGLTVLIFLGILPLEGITENLEVRLAAAHAEKL